MYSSRIGRASVTIISGINGITLVFGGYVSVFFFYPKFSSKYMSRSYFRLISLSMGLLAFNSAGHLSNHADLCPKFAGITFAISNTIVSSFTNLTVRVAL